MSAWWAWADVRAGWIDARRTTRPRPLAGFRFGGWDYGCGYLARVLTSGGRP